MFTIAVDNMVQTRRTNGMWYVVLKYKKGGVDVFAGPLNIQGAKMLLPGS